MNAKSMRPVLLSSILAIGVFAGAAAAEPVDATPQVSMTRSMILFANTERELAGAIGSGDGEATNRLVSPDFEFRPDTHPGDPTTREDWLADATTHGSGTDQLSVRDLGDVAVASFVMSLADDTTSYVVDVWRKQGDDWQLISRYQSALPGTEAPSEDTAPDGKG